MVRNLIAQAAAGGQAIGTLGLIHEEGVPFAQLSCTHMGKVLIHWFAFGRKHSGSDYWESKDRLEALGIEPLKEEVL